MCPYPPPCQGARHPGASQGSVSVGRGQTSFAQERGSPQPSCVHAVPRGSIARSLATAPLRSTLVPLGWPPRNTTIPPARIPPQFSCGALLRPLEPKWLRSRKQVRSVKTFLPQTSPDIPERDSGTGTEKEASDRLRQPSLVRSRAVLYTVRECPSGLYYCTF